MFRYGLALLMVEAGQATLISTTPGETGGAICTFKTAAGDVFSLDKPTMSAEQEAVVKATVRQILDEEGGL